MPRLDRGIQYAAACRLYSDRLWNTGSPDPRAQLRTGRAMTPVCQDAKRNSGYMQGGDMSNQSELDAKIVEDVADALIYSDRSGTIMRWNRAAAALFGFSAAEALGQNLDLIIPEHLRAAHWKGFEAALASGKHEACGQADTDPRAA
ncbi:PAS domain S-box protein [Bradyrhizobium sp. AC87j1]|uniref:PAS domain S-box protein n=1 Tax=Bradyrhizobium sp. AC87j1 TaxID=2055894 RepID=UPI001FE19DEB|nr:PAS domain S-box protein [Bradyrhizobium sp. AC87j1]